jgi:hypothetical protein
MRSGQIRSWALTIPASGMARWKAIAVFAQACSPSAI